MKLWIEKHWHIIILCLIVALYIAYFTTASFLRYDNFYTGRFDLGNMDQTVWNTAHGRLFQLTNPDGTNIISRLAFHADFILVFLAPFYLIWQDPRMLLLIQTAILGCGAFFVYGISNKLIKNKTLSLVLAFAYLMNPSIQFSNLYDFHAVTLATTFFLGAWYFLINKKYILMTTLILLAALTKEQVWLVTAMLGVYIFFQKKTKVWGSIISIFSIITFYFIFFHFIPQARGGNHFALGFYSDFGSSPTEIIKTIILSPQKTISTMFAPDKLNYLLQLFAPLGFISLAAPLFLVFALPDLGINLLSNNQQFHEIYYQYTAIITPFIFIAAIYGTQFLLKKIKKISFLVASCYILITVIISAYLYGPLPLAHHHNTDMFSKPLSYANDIDEFLQRIPTKYSIAATNNVGSHLSHRQKIFTIPVGTNDADIIVFLLNDQFAQPSLKAQKEMVATLRKDPNYFEVIQYNDFVVFAKKSLFNQKLQKAKKTNTILPFLFPTIRPQQ
jgi:uncharacterized membrane protein